MHLSLLSEMAASGCGDRVAFGPREGGLTYAGLDDAAHRAAAWIAAKGAQRVGLVDVSSEVVPILIFGTSVAGVPFVPVNYRLGDEQLRSILARTAPSVFIVEDAVIKRAGDIDGVELVPTDRFVAELAQVPPEAPVPDHGADADAVAILLFTSGTTGDPKAAVLRHKHLGSYVIGTVEFMGAGEEEAALVSVPPYHVAGISAVLSSVYAGRRVVYLSNFSPEAWVEVVRREGITQAMVVPTMFGRILDVIERDGGGLPSLRHLSYGGGRMPLPVIERGLALLPDVAFVNAYGLTETSSTISVLGPEDHRRAMSSADPTIRARLGSVGRPLPTIELEIRDPDDKPVSPGDAGEIWVRGEQVAGEYLGKPGFEGDGWFRTRDEGYLRGGYLYLCGRLDDVIVRGGENMSPGEIEDAIASHPSVSDVAVVGMPDNEWGERVVACVVIRAGTTATDAELKEWVRGRLRSSKVPQQIELRETLPYNDTGKLLRRVLKAELAAG
jgi:fatty-acyl-CoA synthase